MMVMPGNHRSHFFCYLVGKYPGRLGTLQGGTYWNGVVPFIPFALDNDVFFLGNKWTEEGWRGLLRKVRDTGLKPLWTLVPDSVGNRTLTLERWKRYAPEVKGEKAIAVQDSMTPDDVPEDADVVFIGGTTEWKWRTLPMWTKHYPRVHVGRVSTLRRIWMCEDHGAESCDGSGWFRQGADGKRMRGLLWWLEGHRPQNLELPLANTTKGLVLA